MCPGVCPKATSPTRRCTVAVLRQSSDDLDHHDRTSCVRDEAAGVRVIAHAGPWQLDGWAARPVDTTPGVFDDESHHSFDVWGVYGNLLAVQPRSFRVTTDSTHDLEVFLNLARRLTVTGINQLWVADITYIRLQREFVYLAVILDAFSRKVVGWSLDRSLATQLTLAALEQAIATRQPPPGLVHHSDRGIQYASCEYVKLLHRHEMMPSMSRPANPYDNASCESFMKTLKREEIYANDYHTLEHLATNIERFITEYYNRCRLHSALGYRPPDEFERASESGHVSGHLGGATIRFFNNGEDVGNDATGRSSGHVLDRL